MRVKGKVVIITGAGSGMGREEAVLFAKEGATVVATDVNEEAVQAVVQEIEQAGGEAIAMKHNVASRADWEAVYEKVESTYGGLDILVNNAGMSQPESFDDLTDERWDLIVDVNMKSVYYGVQLGIPLMKQRGGGTQ